MPLSSVPTGFGFTPPSGITNVKVSHKRGTSTDLDGTTLSDSERKYFPALQYGLLDRDQTTVSFSFLGEGGISVTPIATKTGWICYEKEIEWSMGELVKGTCTFTNVPS